MAMRRLLLSLVMATLFFSRGFSVSAAVYQHRSVHDPAPLGTWAMVCETWHWSVSTCSETLD